jgi:DNA-binding LytR/AlgR family response regulator
VSAIRAVLCDNEPSWIETATRVLSEYGRESGCELKVTSYTSPNELLESNELAPDVLFCDIELGETENGIDLVGGLSHRWPRCQVVYVTNFLRYAPEVYVTEHLWFVLKERFASRLPEIMEKLERKMDSEGRALMIRTISREMVAIPCPQLLSFERRGRMTIINLVNGQSYEVSDRLPTLLDRLPSRDFARCHASFAVNFNHVRLVRANDLVLDDGSELPISRRFGRGFRERYLDWADDHAV